MLELIALDEAVEVGDPTDVALARRRAQARAAEAGLDELRMGELALVTTELASNIIKHAGQGGVLLGSMTRGAERGVVVCAWDRGPGMNLAHSLVDGVSHAGTSGTGLGAVARLATHWDGFSAPGRGSVIAAAMYAEKQTTRPAFCCAGVCLPFPGERVCGDAWRAHGRDGVASVMVADGLGHGLLAAEASRAVCEAFEQNADASPAAILQHAQGAARPTRGAAAAVARIDLAAQRVTFSGVGNIAGWLFSNGTLRSMLSFHGTLGHTPSRPREENYPLPPNGSVILASDGLKSRWDLAEYPELGQRASVTLAALLWRDFSRGRDDATVLVVVPQKACL